MRTSDYDPRDEIDIFWTVNGEDLGWSLKIHNTCDNVDMIKRRHKKKKLKYNNKNNMI